MNGDVSMTIILEVNVDLNNYILSVLSCCQNAMQKNPLVAFVQHFDKQINLRLYFVYILLMVYSTVQSRLSKGSRDYKVVSLK